MKNKKTIAVLCLIIIGLIVTGFAVHNHNVKKAEQEKAEAEKQMEDQEAAEHLTVGLKGSEVTKVMQGEKYTESGAFCIDDRTGAVTECNISGKVDTDKPGEYEIEYKFTSDGGTKSITRKVQVIPEKDFRKNTEGIPVLMYHYVYSDSEIPENLNGNYIKDTDLEAQLEYLKDNDYYFPSFSELRAYVDGEISLPEKSVIVTFDDGQYGFLNYGIPVIEKCKVPAVSFVIGTKEAADKMLWYGSRYVNYQSHSYDMHKAGGNIGHGGVISAMSKDQIKEDLKMIAEITGSNDAFAYPFGDVTEDAEAAVRESEIKCAFTTEYGKVMPGMDFTTLPRVRVQGQNSLDAWAASL